MDKHDQRKQHEQELEQNDLLTFLTHFRLFWDKHGTTILLMVLIVVAIVVGVPWLRGRAEAKREAAGMALVEAASVQSSRARAFANVAEEHADQPGVAAYALLRAGDVKLYEALGLLEEASGPDATKPMLSEETIEQLDTAAEYYQRAIATAPGGENALLALNARFGLADVHTSKGEFEEARNIYEQIREAADEPFPALAAQATARMRRLAEYNTAITFPARAEDDLTGDLDLGQTDAVQQMVEEAERRMAEEAEAEDDQADDPDEDADDADGESQDPAADDAADPESPTAPQPE